MVKKSTKTPGRLFVISSPSGGGKTTLSDRVLAQDARVVRSISATTRAPRLGEQAGVDYFFLTPEKFDRLTRQGAFLEWAEVHGHKYGTLADQVRRHQKAGRDVFLVIDVQGGLAVKRQDPRAVLIFVRPPSLQALRDRLVGRGTENPQTIRRRLHNALGELKLASQYDYQVVNQELEKATEELRAILTAERLRVIPRLASSKRHAVSLPKKLKISSGKKG
jgi:guanylate kinase